MARRSRSSSACRPDDDYRGHALRGPRLPQDFGEVPQTRGFKAAAHSPVQAHPARYGPKVRSRAEVPGGSYLAGSGPVRLCRPIPISPLSRRRSSSGFIVASWSNRLVIGFELYSVHHRGGANGSRIPLLPQRMGRHEPMSCRGRSPKSTRLRDQCRWPRIVLAGTAAVGRAKTLARIEVPFTGGRGDRPGWRLGASPLGSGADDPPSLTTK